MKYSIFSLFALFFIALFCFSSCSAPTFGPPAKVAIVADKTDKLDFNVSIDGVMNAINVNYNQPVTFYFGALGEGSMIATTKRVWDPTNSQRFPNPGERKNGFIRFKASLKADFARMKEISEQKANGASGNSGVYLPLCNLTKELGDASEWHLFVVSNMIENSDLGRFYSKRKWLKEPSSVCSPASGGTMHIVHQPDVRDDMKSRESKTLMQQAFAPVGSVSVKASI